MRRALGWALLLAALTAPVAAADPFDAAPVLTVAGSGPSTTAFTLDSTMSFRYSDARVTGTGRYAGFEIYAASGRWYGGLVSVPELDQPPQPMAVRTPTVFEAGPVTLPPGRYRVYLLADASAEIRLPLTAGQGLTVRPTTPVKETFHVATAAVETGRTSLALRQLVTATKRTRTFVIGQYGPGALTADLRLRACLARRNKACGAHNGVTSTGATMTTTQVGLGDSSWLPDRTPRDARVEAALSPDARAAWLSLAVVQYDRI